VNGGIKLPKTGGLKMDVLHHNSLTISAYIIFIARYFVRFQTG